MARMGVRGADEVGALASSLRAAAAGKLQREARQGIRDASRPVLADLRVAVRAVDVTSSRGGGTKSTKLRARISRALTARSATTGIRFLVIAGKVDPRYGHSLPRYLDAELARYRTWRHPTFGRPPWVSQYGRPWFFVTIRRHTQRFERAVEAAIERTLEQITRG